MQCIPEGEDDTLRLLYKRLLAIFQRPLVLQAECKCASFERVPEGGRNILDELVQTKGYRLLYLL